MHTQRTAWLLAGVVLAGQGFSTQARAVTVDRGLTANPVTFCQAALPAYEGLIRKRPLAVQNEGTATAFVTCGFVNDATSTGTRKVFAYFLNNDSAARQVTCTLVTSVAGATNLYFTKSITIPANSTGQFLTWEAGVDTGGTYFSRWVALSCSLPVGTGIAYLASFHDSNVGA